MRAKSSINCNLLIKHPIVDFNYYLLSCNLTQFGVQNEQVIDKIDYVIWFEVRKRVFYLIKNFEYLCENRFISLVQDGRPCL